MAGRIPQEFLDHLLSRTDIVEVIDSRVSLRKAGRNYMACCPFHNEKTPSFTVSSEKQFYHCFGCGAHGNAISFLLDYERLEFPEAVEDLARAAGLEIPRQTVVTEQQHGDLYDIMARADQFFRRQLRQHTTRNKAVDYLLGRGLDGETVKTFGIGYAPSGWDNLLKALTAERCSRSDLINAGLVAERESGGVYDRFRDRIMFPIQDRRGRTIAFGGRALTDENTPKYLNSPETALFHKGQELYGLYQARISTRSLERLLIVEGYMDVVALAQHGIRYAVATLGTATTAEHLERLFRTCREMVFCFDGDRAGREAAWRALENTLPLLREGRQAGFLFLPENEDPDSLVRQQGRKVFEQLLQQSLSLSEYFFQHLTARNDINTLEGRARMVEQAQPLLQRLPESVLKDMLFQQLTDIARISLNRLNPAKSNHVKPARAISDKQVRRTPPRYAIALLLKEPELAQQAGDTRVLHGLDIPGIPLLAEIIEFLKVNPHISYLWEKYRDTETKQILSQLINWQPLISESLFAAEFLETMQQINKLTEDYVFDKLRQSSFSALNEDERALLRNYRKST